MSQKLRARSSNPSTHPTSPQRMGEKWRRGLIYPQNQFFGHILMFCFFLHSKKRFVKKCLGLNFLKKKKATIHFFFIEHNECLLQSVQDDPFVYGRLRARYEDKTIGIPRGGGRAKPPEEL